MFITNEKRTSFNVRRPPRAPGAEARPPPAGDHTCAAAAPGPVAPASLPTAWTDHSWETASQAAALHWLAFVAVVQLSNSLVVSGRRSTAVVHKCRTTHR